MEDTILYSSCFDANGGLFETLVDDQDAVISDALNHASIIDGIRLCKARRLRYANNDMNELERALKDSQDSRVRLIATDGVFSMDGSIANLKDICDLADRYGALVMVDDSNATYFREQMQGLGFNLIPGEHPIIPVMLGEAPLAVNLADRVQAQGVYVVAFAFPVVPHGKARIRTQMSAAHSREQLDRVIQAFSVAGRELSIIH